MGRRWRPSHAAWPLQAATVLSPVLTEGTQELKGGELSVTCPRAHLEPRIRAGHAMRAAGMNRTHSEPGLGVPRSRVPTLWDLRQFTNLAELSCRWDS